MHRVSVGQHFGDEGVSGLMVGGDFFFLGAYSTAPSLRTGDYPVDGFLKLLHSNGVLAPSNRQDSRLIDQIGDVGAAEASGLFPQYFETNRFRQWFAIGMDL